MDIVIGSNDFQLCLHPTYCTNDDGSILQVVSKYKPFVDWLTRFQPQQDAGNTTKTRIARVIVRNVQWIAKRIAVLAVDVEFSNAARQTLVQSAVFTDEPQTVLLPILSVNGFKYGIVITQPRLALGGKRPQEALLGTVTKEGFSGLGAAELAKFGFSLSGSGLVALRPTPLSFGEGLLPHTLLKTVHALCPEDAAPLLTEAGVAVNDVNANGAALHAVPLDVLASKSADLKVLTAANLALI